MNEKETLLRVLEAGGHDQALAFARALLPDQPAPGPAAGATAPSAGASAMPAGLAAAAADPANAAQLGASAAGDHQSERDRYERMNQHELAALSDDEFRRALSLIKGP